MTVNPNGGSYSNTTSSVVQSPNLIYNSGNWWSIGKAERAGYTLTGYFTSAGGGTKVYDSNGECINGCGYWNEGKYINDGDLTIYAQWTPDTYTVKLNANGGTVSSESVQVTYDSTYNNLPTPERTGYNFNGWYTSADGGTQIANSDKVKITSELQLYAHWSKDKFLITFDAMGGTALTTTKLVTYDKAYGVLPTAEKSGYTFKGWYLDKECKTQITSDTVVNLTANQSVYAKWELRKYVVFFDSNGGECSTSSKQVTYGKKYGVLPVPTKENDEFSGWFTKDGIQIVSSDTVELTADTTLYAKWKSENLSGDINFDGKTDISDAVLLQGYVLCKNDFSEEEYNSSDLNSNGYVNAFDLIILKKRLINKEVF